MAMKTNPSTVQQATAQFVTSAKAITHLGGYIEPTSGKLVDVHYDQTNHQVCHDIPAGVSAPTIVFARYADFAAAKQGKNLVRLGAFSGAQGVAQAWYDPATNTTFLDTVTV